MNLDVLPHCIDDENPKKFENITAGEFLEERLEIWATVTRQNSTAFPT